MCMKVVCACEKDLGVGVTDESRAWGTEPHNLIISTAGTFQKVVACVMHFFKNSRFNRLIFTSYFSDLILKIWFIIILFFIWIEFLKFFCKSTFVLKKIFVKKLFFEKIVKLYFQQNSNSNVIMCNIESNISKFLFLSQIT